MANTFTTQTIHDGPRNVVIHAYLASDGAAGDETFTLVDASALSPVPSGNIVFAGIHADLIGFSAKLLWDATSNVPFFAIPSDDDVDIWYGAKDTFGGIPNNAGAGKTQDVLLATNGMTDSGDIGHVTIWFRKPVSNA